MTEQPVMAEVQSDPTYFENRYPTLWEVLHDGGKCGVMYAWVSGGRMGEFEKELDAEGNTWSLILGVPTITIAGPKGTCDTVKLMGRGKPVEGAGDFNGVRVVVVDRVLEETTGILAQKLPVPEEPKSAPAQGKKQSGD